MAGSLYRLEKWIFCSGDSMGNWRGWNLWGIPDLGGDGEFGVDGKFSKDGEVKIWDGSGIGGMAQEFVKEGRRDNLEDGEFGIS